MYDDGSGAPTVPEQLNDYSSVYIFVSVRVSCMKIYDCPKSFNRVWSRTCSKRVTEAVMRKRFPPSWYDAIKKN